MSLKLYNTRRCPYARRTRMVLHVRGHHQDRTVGVSNDRIGDARPA